MHLLYDFWVGVGGRGWASSGIILEIIWDHLGYLGPAAKTPGMVVGMSLGELRRLRQHWALQGLLRSLGSNECDTRYLKHENSFGMLILGCVVRVGVIKLCK